MSRSRTAFRQIADARKDLGSVDLEICEVRTHRPLATVRATVVPRRLPRSRSPARPHVRPSDHRVDLVQHRRLVRSILRNRTDSGWPDNSPRSLDDRFDDIQRTSLAGPPDRRGTGEQRERLGAFEHMRSGAEQRPRPRRASSRSRWNAAGVSLGQPTLLQGSAPGESRSHCLDPRPISGLSWDLRGRAGISLSKSPERSAAERHNFFHRSSRRSRRTPISSTTRARCTRLVIGRSRSRRRRFSTAAPTFARVLARRRAFPAAYRLLGPREVLRFR